MTQTLESNEYQPTPATATTAVVGIGSNAPDGRERVEGAFAFLASVARIEARSSVYTTAPWGKRSGRDYTNAVGIVAVDMPFESFEEILKGYERCNGRDEQSRQLGRVPVDLDIVYWGARCLRPHEISRGYFSRGYEECLKQDETPLRDQSPEIM